MGNVVGLTVIDVVEGELLGESSGELLLTRLASQDPLSRRCRE